MKAKVLPLFILAALSTTALAATPPNTLVVVQSLDDIVSLDPAEANELSSIQTVPSLYQRLVQADRDNPAKVIPVLAESWQDDAAAKTLTVKLRPQAAFSSGNPLTADDVIFSYTRAVKMNKSPAFILNVLGWQPDNIEQQLKKIRRAYRATELDGRRQPGGCPEYPLDADRLNRRQQSRAA